MVCRHGRRVPTETRHGVLGDSYGDARAFVVNND